ncbi:hypothetical protein SAMN05216360_12947 [Methylobacterium phyllostachyos]|uniref:Uncharacterized protein n=1 Tax=Methylobacterium phyllostachyos TaxID=582672 RepID=A0A1H0KXC4_9HYPH|nr:hypothetical protein [Methylobacterium phyllostachyos]SDO60432.1 hypothetical protein SAMN05216360_12947 [Methylobacterium phyllostachyos]
MVDMQKAIIAFSNICLGDTLEKMAIELAKHNGGRPGAWLDAIEKAAIDNARHSHSEGLTVEEEHKVLDGAIKMLQFNFHNIREELNKKPD